MPGAMVARIPQELDIYITNLAEKLAHEAWAALIVAITIYGNEES